MLKEAGKKADVAVFATEERAQLMARQVSDEGEQVVASPECITSSRRLQ